MEYMFEELIDFKIEIIAQRTSTAQGYNKNFKINWQQI